MLTHNHPSGTLRPSEADKRLTEKIIKAGKLLDVKVLGLLIIMFNKQYYSHTD
ncbi:JAB domain-containing protein [Zobellia laminariae]|nr:JAB domain-containing protein [Zobellia laminariae]WKX78661.1 JAB domain-containing protein [Zobellia laminariae]